MNIGDIDPSDLFSDSYTPTLITADEVAAAGAVTPPVTNASNTQIVNGVETLAVTASPLSSVPWWVWGIAAGLVLVLVNRGDD